MSTIDSRIVTAKFDNSSFLSGIGTTLAALAKLRDGLNLSGASKGLSEINAAAQKTDLTPVSSSIDGINARFAAMATIAITALNRITNSAIDAGVNIGKAFTTAPLLDGFSEYELQINSTKTILSNVAQSGAGLKEVGAALDELNEYADLTIYNFAQMTDSIGKFTAAGVDLDTATASIKGIANMAALGGASAMDASRAMYQLSQAISAGKVGLMDWKSVENANMATSQFKNALAQTAVAMGELDMALVKNEGKMKNVTIAGKSFRDSIMSQPGEESWLTSDVLTSTLEVMTGDLTDAELAARGYNKEQIKSLQLTAKMAVESATQVRTFTGFMDTLKESVASGWASSARILVGDLEEATDLWSGAKDTISGYLDEMAENRNRVLARWDELGGRNQVLAGIKAGFRGLVDIIQSINGAFRDIFPRKTGRELRNLSEGFKEFMQSLRLSDEILENIKRTFRGVFAVFSIIGQVVKGLAGVFFDLFKTVGSGTGGILEFTGGIGDFFVAVDKALKEGEGLTNFFQGLTNVIKKPLEALGQFIDKIVDITGLGDSISTVGGDIEGALKPVEVVGSTISNVFTKLGEMLANIGGFVADAISAVGSAIAGAITPDVFSGTLDIVNTALFGGLILLLQRFVSNGLKFDFGGGFFQSATDTLSSVQGVLEGFQANLKANALLKIAGALALLTASIVVLSLIDSKKLSVGLAGMTAGLVGLQVSLAGLAKFVSVLGAAKLPFIAVGLLALGVAMLTLSIALKIMSTIDIADMGVALLGMSASLVVMTGAMVVLSAATKGALRTGAAILLIAIALNAIAAALKVFATFDLQELGMGLLGMASALLVIAGAMRVMPKNILVTATGLLALGVALNVIAVAMKVFASMGVDDIAKAMLAIAGALVAIGLGLRAMPKWLILKPTALLVVAGAILILAGAMRLLGGMKLSSIGKALLAIGGVLLVLAVGLKAMTTALPGAAALLVAAAALAIFVPVLAALGNMDWGTILKSLVFLAGLFTVLGLAAYLLAPLTPVILGLSAAILILGAGIALMGLGAVALSTAFATMVALGEEALIVFEKFIGLIPSIVVAVGKGLVGVVEVVGESAVVIAQAFGKVASAILDELIKLIPKVGVLISKVIQTIIRVVGENVPKIVQAGFRLLIALLDGIANNIGKVVKSAVDVIVAFAKAIGENLDRVIKAGVRLVIDLVQGIADAIDENSSDMIDAGYDLAGAIIEGMAKGILEGPKRLAGAIGDLAGGVIGGIGNALGINSPAKKAIPLGQAVPEGLAVGIKSYGRVVDDATKKVADDAIVTLKKSMDKMSSVSLDDISSNPTISPVLDLTRLQNEASKIGTMLPNPTISADLTASQVAGIMADSQATKDESAEPVIITRDVKFEQTITSPKAVSAAEVWKGTRNQLSLAEEVLKNYGTP